jgi:hypothetical protein
MNYNPGALTLDSFLRQIAKAPCDLPVAIQHATEGVVYPAGRLHSYRGYYEDLALDYDDTSHGITVKDLQTNLLDAYGTEMSGYKGGTYPITARTWLWIDHYDTYAAVYPTGLTVEPTCVFIDTASEYDANL